MPEEWTKRMQIDALSRPSGTLRNLYASPRNLWTPMETLDRKMGAVTGNPLNGALSVCPHDPMVPGSIPGGPTRTRARDRPLE